VVDYASLEDLVANRVSSKEPTKEKIKQSHQTEDFYVLEAEKHMRLNQEPVRGSVVRVAGSISSIQQV
jgi:hypothetical protein